MQVSLAATCPFGVTTIALWSLCLYVALRGQPDTEERGLEVAVSICGSAPGVPAKGPGEGHLASMAPPCCPVGHQEPGGVMGGLSSHGTVGGAE